MEVFARCELNSRECSRGLRGLAAVLSASGR